MNILGLSAFYHDSAACLLQDGKIVAAAQEERFSRKKHDPRFPKNIVTVVALTLFGALIVFTESSAVAPFIYALF